jgi:hypothetical protein
MKNDGWTEGSVAKRKYEQKHILKAREFKCSGCRKIVTQVFRLGHRLYCTATCYMTHNPMVLTGDESRIDQAIQDNSTRRRGKHNAKFD